MKKVLLALDCSVHSQKAATYIGEFVPFIPGGEVVLLTVLTGIPYGEGEVGALEGLPVPPEVHGDEDHTQERAQAKALHEAVRNTLIEKGLSSANVRSVVKPAHRGIARDILDEASAVGCDLVVVGRRGLGRMQDLLQGSVSREVVQKADGHSVLVVG